ncbi:MAG: Rrf2 family transcriptional regulator [Pseudomonadota bacterium]
MRLSSKTGIGIRALFDMAFHCRGRQAQAREIARRQHISIRTLEEVLQDLRRSGLIGAQRGRRGGYALARAAEEITVSQIVRALEGPLGGSLPPAEPAGPRGVGAKGLARTGGRSARGRRHAGVSPADGATTAAGAGSAAGGGDGAADVPALIWEDIAGRIAAALDQTTLGDFIARAESAGVKRAVVEPPMYFI